ncbi:MAG: KamA family radical SAM protein [Chloroflexi bacterium]|nr:KamA family radical SAM protein [Chloroflexota bacterium]
MLETKVPEQIAEVEDEPPGSRLRLNRSRYFPGVSDVQWNDWRWHFRHRTRSVSELAKLIPLSRDDKARLKLVTLRYPFSITPYYFCLIDFADPQDPIRRQAVPTFEEVSLAHMGMEDPLAEEHHSVVPGLVHRYPDRVLMVMTDICAVLCRHCTRKREWHHGGWIRPTQEIDAMLDYIGRNRQIRDVIISGGDPLVLSTSYLETVLTKLRRIPHVEIIRIGTRLPVVLPQRIDQELCTMLSKYGPIWLNTHFNHPNEVTPQAAAVCDRLLRSGIPVNNQSVLLRGVNDTVETQLRLCHALLRAKVRPYYLFQCDEVQGTEHLRTSVETGLKIIQGMRGFTSGLAVPTYVIDLPGGGGKVPLQPDYIVSQADGELVLRNYEGRLFRYRNPGSPVATSPIPATAYRGVKDANRTLVRS